MDKPTAVRLSRNYEWVSYLFCYLRTLLIHGARVVASWAQRRPQDNRPMARWLRALIARRGKNKAIVALANKLARIAWVVLARDASFDPGKAFTAT